MILTEEDINALITFLRNCIWRRYNHLKRLSPASRWYEHTYLARKHCIMEACKMLFKCRSKYERAMITACSQALFSYLRHGNKQALLNALNAIYGRIHA